MRQKEIRIMNADQTERYVSLLEEQIETYGLKEVWRFLKYPSPSTLGDSGALLNHIMYNDFTISNFNVIDVCECLAINPNYVFTGKGPIYVNEKR